MSKRKRRIIKLGRLEPLTAKDEKLFLEYAKSVIFTREPTPEEQAEADEEDARAEGLI